ncbi:hypothetical protein EV672_10563 [Aquabacterium commune]|uniref:Uncharacterized protein n=1 Tax=Aquabacterium commune TaxID=70586 RepID=A0A4R6RB75_9BURK|nr:hypothetical protein [Aquabacterium commune]TDP82876.1 hypothetical protein EV672_10563 [Aquabacterium commune]
MLTQQRADQLIKLAKEALARECVTWQENQRQEEMVIAVEDRGMQFLFSMKRNPHEITAQLRTRDRHIPLARIDNAAQHVNPDGNVLRGPHLHWYREGEGLAWAEAIDWYDVARPMDTLVKFLDLIGTRFPAGLQEALL